jgi:amino acid permease
LLGAVGLWLTILAKDTSVTPWLTAPSILVLGVGMGACFSSIYEVALGDIAQEEAGSASGSLSAVQQLAAAIGSAIVTTVFFSVLRDSGGAKAMTVSVLVVVAVIAICLGLVWLLPRTAPSGEMDPEAMSGAGPELNALRDGAAV